MKKFRPTGICAFCNNGLSFCEYLVWYSTIGRLLTVYMQTSISNRSKHINLHSIIVYKSQFNNIDMCPTFSIATLKLNIIRNAMTSCLTPVELRNLVDRAQQLWHYVIRRSHCNDTPRPTWDMRLDVRIQMYGCVT